MKLLITGAWRHTPEQLETIKALGHSVTLLRNEWDPLTIPYEEVEAVICNGLFLYHPIEKFTALKYIQLTSAGYDRVPMDYARSHQIVVHNATGVYSVPMAEFAVASVLQFYKQSAFFREIQKKHIWEKHRGLLELHGKNVCIVGCGSVGLACAERFRAFGCRIIGVNRTVRPCQAFDTIYPLDQLHEALRHADVAILSIALTQDTRCLIDEAAISAMKNGAVLVNIARSSIVDTQSLTQALMQRRLYAALDVFDEEPLSPDSSLWDMENVILTPHNSFVGDANADRLSCVIMENLERMQ